MRVTSDCLTNVTGRTTRRASARGPLVAPESYVGRSSRWQDAAFRDRRVQWAYARNREGYSVPQVAAALQISCGSLLRLFHTRGLKVRYAPQHRLSIRWGSMLSINDFSLEELRALEVIVEKRGYASARDFFRACVVDGIQEECEELGIKEAQP